LALGFKVVFSLTFLGLKIDAFKKLSHKQISKIFYLDNREAVFGVVFVTSFPDNDNVAKSVNPISPRPSRRTIFRIQLQWP
jgi:hypothetical protein